MRLLGRLILLPLGLLLAVPTGIGALATAALLDPATADFARLVFWSEAFALADSWLDGDVEIAWTSFRAMGWASTLLVAPPVFTALIGEVAGFRSLAWYAGGTGAVTAALPWLLRQRLDQADIAEGRLTLVLFAVGACAGLVYWLIAGWSAGCPRPVSGPASSRS